MELFPILQYYFTKHSNIKEISSQVAMQKLHTQQWKESSKNSKALFYFHLHIPGYALHKKKQNKKTHRHHTQPIEDWN